VTVKQLRIPLMITDIPVGIQTEHIRHKSLERFQYIGLLNETHM